MPRRINKIPRTCLICETSFLIWPHESRKGRGKFCSLECYGKAVTLGVLQKHRHKPPVRVERVCENCGQTFQAKPAEVRRGGGKYCSRECYRVGACIPLGRQFLRNVGEPNENGCILWQGATSRGYGTFGTIGQRNVRAHRFAWELAYGPIPKGLQILHSCDRPACVNPLHLSVGTHKDNCDDKVAKGRHCAGEGCNLAKLTASKVGEIRKRYHAGGVTQKELATEYNTCVQNICAIINRRSWKHVP